MKRIVALGEIMGRLAPQGFLRFPQSMPGHLDFLFTGAEANVAVSLAILGADVSFVSALPDHAIADACMDSLRARGVDTRHIVRTSEGRLGLFYVEKGANQRAGNVIYDRAGSSMAITPSSAYSWAAIFDGAGWFHTSGITAAISRIGAEVMQTALREAASRGLRISFDMNYRSKLWRWDANVAPLELASRTLQEILPWVHIFSGGREEGAMLGIYPRVGATDPDLDLARQIVERYPNITHIVTSLRESISASHNNCGGMLYDAALDQAFYAPLNQGVYHPYEITDIVDRLGAGDAFSAGLIFALNTPGWSEPARAVEFGVAAACLAHSIEGDFNFSTRSEIEELAGGAVSGRIRR